MKAAIIIPAYNEAGSIARVVESVRSYGIPIVVDDGCSDETGRRAAEAGATVVRHEANRGYDAALATGFAEAERIGAELVVTFDADGQLDSSSIPVVIDALKRPNVGLVIGVRDAAARFSESLFNLYAKLRFGVPDMLCGLKGFRMGWYASHRESAETASVNTAFALALLRQNIGFALVPVAINPRAGDSRFGTWRGNVKILRALASALMQDARR